jgi:cytochrome c-type biogenesis protein CcmH/NrfG
MPALFQRRRSELISASIIVAAVMLTFGGILRHGFMEDWDDNLICDNPHLTTLNWENLQWAFTDITAHRRHIYMPFSWVWWSVVNQTAGLSPVVYHGINLLVHAVNSVLVFFLVRKLLRTWGPDRAPMTGAAGPAEPTVGRGNPPATTGGQGEFWLCAISVIAALFWALHPLRVEPVAWAITQKFLIATSLVLLSLFFYLRRIETSRAAWHASGWHWLSVGSFGASLLFYPVALAWPAVLAVVEFAWPRTIVPTPTLSRRIRNVLAAASPFALCSLLAVSVPLVVARQDPTPAVEAMRGTASPWISQSMEAAYMWMYYAWKPLVPGALSPIYTTLLRFDPWSAPFVASLLGLLAVTTLVTVWWRACPWAPVLWSCHLLLLIPMLGFGVNREMYPNDRYSYLQGICWALLLGLLLARLTWHRPAYLRWAWLLPGGCALAALGVASHRQTAIWNNNVTLFQHILRAPDIDNYRFDIRWRLAEFHLARQDYAAAQDTLNQALKIKPQDPVSWFLLAETHASAGDFASAEQSARRSLELDPQPETRRLLVTVCISAKDYPAAIAALREGLKHDSNDSIAHFTLAALLAQQGARQEALGELDQVLRLEPSHADARALQAELLQQTSGAGTPLPR